MCGKECVSLIICVLFLSAHFYKTIHCKYVKNDGGLEFKYHSNVEIKEFLKNFTESNPDLTSLYSIGKSILGYDLHVVKVTAITPGTSRPTNIKLVANIHGNEAVGREVLLHFLPFVINKYHDGDPKIKHLLKNNVIHVMPSLNPDGFEKSLIGKCSQGPGRANARGYDLNRNFPDSFIHNTNQKQIETRAVEKWMNDIKFILSASIHGGAMVANYPYESKNPEETRMNEPHKSPDDDVFRHLALAYSEAHPVMHLGAACPNEQPGFPRGFPRGITNGAAWYSLTGGMQDYNYMVHGCMEITLEISCCKYPQAQELPALWEQNRNALVEFCMQAGIGIKGTVRDNITGAPIQNASLMVRDRDMVFHTSKTGDFFRILLPDDYELKIWANGYSCKVVNITVKNVKEGEYPVMEEIDIYLSPTYLNKPDEDFKEIAPERIFYNGEDYEDQFARNITDTDTKTINYVDDFLYHGNYHNAGRQNEMFTFVTILSIILVLSSLCDL